jgi:hypothetical protein
METAFPVIEKDTQRSSFAAADDQVLPTVAIEIAPTHSWAKLA